MSRVRSHGSSTDTADIRGLTEALAGAFAEGVDLGPRAPQIRALGQSLEAAIEALRLKLGAFGSQVQIAGQTLDLNQLARMARAARTYGTGETE
jgi:hypothetical protein